jgi:exodeoxyribonuclease VII large subunit
MIEKSEKDLTDRPHVFTVSELNRRVRGLLENSFPIIWVSGEISDFTWHTSGHIYFSLKDHAAQLRCVMWRDYNQNLFFTPRQGLSVQVRGKISLYEKGGQYQLQVYQMEQQGVGDLRLAFERLSAKLRTEGLFDQQHKKPLPRFPWRIGVVTSPTGAAVKDIIGVITRRFPPAKILLYPVAVQGEGAAEQIAEAIQEFNRHKASDVIIIGRGGGSPEDLWAFNEEVVARAIFASRIPIISAVGHEIDVTISDLVADLRVPTPSAAGEMAVPDYRQVLAMLQTMYMKLVHAAQQLISGRKKHLQGLKTSHGMKRPRDLIDGQWQRLRSREHRLCSAIHRLEQDLTSQLRAQAEKLSALDPEAVLVRGYSICRHLPDRHIITDARHLHPDDGIEVTFARGIVEGSVTRVRPDSRAKKRRTLKSGR